MTKVLASITRTIDGYYQQKKEKKSSISAGGKTGYYAVI
jgi:hypothetical protein